MAPKMKGIVQQSVKEVLQSLVDDDLVMFEKIGTSNYYWSFPSTALQSRMNKIAKLEQDIERDVILTQDCEKQIDCLKQGREETNEYLLVKSELEELQKQHALIVKEFDKYREMDPDLFDARKEQLRLTTQAINVWTDNIYTLQSYCSSKFNVLKTDFDVQFGIPDDLDYI